MAPDMDDTMSMKRKLEDFEPHPQGPYNKRQRPGALSCSSYPPFDEAKPNAAPKPDDTPAPEPEDDDDDYEPEYELEDKPIGISENEPKLELQLEPESQPKYTPARVYANSNRNRPTHSGTHYLNYANVPRDLNPDDYLEDMVDVLNYLDDVRNEAYAIPSIVKQETPEVEEGEYDAAIYDTGIGDTRGSFKNGVYAAAPTYGPEVPPTSSSFDPQAAYCTRLLTLFKAQREFLSTAPPETSVDALPPEHAIKKDTWKHLLIAENPSAVQIASLSDHTVLRVLQYARGQLLRGKNITHEQSAWLWGLLAKVNEVGVLDNFAVSNLRELGKRAVWVQLGYTKFASATEGMVDDESEEDGESEEERIGRRNTSSPPVSPQLANGNIESAKKTEHEEGEVIEIPNANTRATLDMIIMVVGELYGQRDLLEQRESWQGT